MVFTSSRGYQQLIAVGPQRLYSPVLCLWPLGYGNKERGLTLGRTSSLSCDQSPTEKWIHSRLTSLCPFPEVGKLIASGLGLRVWWVVEYLVTRVLFWRIITTSQKKKLSTSSSSPSFAIHSFNSFWNKPINTSWRFIVSNSLSL